MAFEIHNATTIGIILLVAEILFWLAVGFGVVKWKKNKEKPWKSPFKPSK